MTWQHGRSTGYRIHGCHCDACKAAHAGAQKSFRAKRYAARVLLWGRLYHPDAPHGTKGGYTNYGCRCTGCSLAMRGRVA